MMVKYISFMIILGVSLLFTSCVYHFDLDEAEGIPKLVVYSYPGSGDTTVVRFSRSLPVTGKGGNCFWFDRDGCPAGSKRYTCRSVVDGQSFTECSRQKLLYGAEIRGRRSYPADSFC